MAGSKRRNARSQSAQGLRVVATASPAVHADSDTEPASSPRDVPSTDPALTKQPETGMRKILTRARFAFLMMGGFLLIVFGLGHLGVCLLIIILQTMIHRELVSLRHERIKLETDGEIQWFRSIQWAWFFVAMVYAYSTSYLKAPMGALETLVHFKLMLQRWGIVDELAFVQMISFSLSVVAFIATVLTFRKGLYKVQITQLTWTALILTVLIVGQMKFAVYMVYEGLFWFLFPVSLVVANDTFAYFSGLAFGRKFISAPFLQLSPNKTWEGFIGGFILTLTYAVLGAPVWGSNRFLRCSFEELERQSSTCFSDHLFLSGPDGAPAPIIKHAVFYALFASLIAPFGGFFASAVKRAFKIKDFDSVIPGHGGVTDRMDCQLMNQLFNFVYYTTFITALHLKMPLPQLKAFVERLDVYEQRELFESLKRMLAITP